MRKRIWSLLLIAATVLVAGCGGGDSTTTTPTVAEAPPPGPQTPAAVEDLAERLEAAGLPAQPTYLNEGTSDMHIGGVEITYYANPAEAAHEGGEIEQIAANHPSKMLALTHIPFIVWVANQNGLKASEEAAFTKIAGIVSRLG